MTGAKRNPPPEAGGRRAVSQTPSTPKIAGTAAAVKPIKKMFCGDCDRLIEQYAAMDAWWCGTEGHRQYRHNPAREPGQHAAPPPESLIWRTAADILDAPVSMPDVLIEGLSYRGELGLLTGPFDALKSRLGMEIARALVSGEPLLGRWPVLTPVPTIYIQEEINPGVFDNERVIPLLEGLPREAAERLIIVSRSGFRLDLEWIDLLEETITKTGAVAVVIDPLSEVTPIWPGFNLNFDTSVTEMFRPLKDLRDRYNLTIFLVHHDPKASEFERRARGSSVLMNAPDLRILLQGIDSADGYHRSRVQVRSRNMRRPDPFNILCLENGRVVWEEPMSISSPEKDSVVRAIKYLTKDGQGPMTTEIAEAIGISQDATKKRLLRVKTDGLVDSNRDGRNTRWTLTDSPDGTEDEEQTRRDNTDCI